MRTTLAAIALLHLACGSPPPAYAQSTDLLPFPEMQPLGIDPDLLSPIPPPVTFPGGDPAAPMPMPMPGQDDALPEVFGNEIQLMNVRNMALAVQTIGLHLDISFIPPDLSDHLGRWNERAQAVLAQHAAALQADAVARSRYDALNAQMAAEFDAALRDFTALAQMLKALHYQRLENCTARHASDIIAMLCATPEDADIAAIPLPAAAIALLQKDHFKPFNYGLTAPKPKELLVLFEESGAWIPQTQRVTLSAPIMVELVFDRPAEAPEHTVLLRLDEQEQRVTVRQIASDPTRYRSDPFIVSPAEVQP